MFSSEQKRKAIETYIRFDHSAADVLIGKLIAIAESCETHDELIETRNKLTGRINTLTNNLSGKRRNQFHFERPSSAHLQMYSSRR